MENSPSPALTERDSAGKLLLRGLDDWVSLDEARWAVSLVEPGSAAEIREATLRAMAVLVENGFARLGALSPGFVPWSLPPAEALRRVRTTWWDPEAELRPGNVCWIENTPAGDEVARRIEAARGE